MCSEKLPPAKPITGFYHGLGKDLFAKMMQQDHPHLNIHYERRPGINASIIQIAPNTVIPENFAPAKIEIIPDYVTRDKELSANIIKQLVPTKARYKPEVGGKPFVPHSAREIPNVMAKEQIKACAEMVAICRSCNKDPIAIKKFFNRNWGLPDEFDVEKYSPIVDPTRSKAWLRWETQQNYEVHYAQDAQAMIHVSAGSYTNQSKFGTFAVDWAQIRNHMRIIATNVFLCEPGVIQKVLADNVKIELNFAVNFLEHSEVMEPTFAFRPDNGIIATPMLPEDVHMLMNDVGIEKRSVQDRKAEIFRLLPQRVIEEIRDQKEATVAITTSFSDSMSSNALTSEVHGAARKIVVTQPNPKTVTRSLQSCIKQFLKSWLLQSREAMACAHSISAKYLVGKKDDAMSDMLKILDPHILNTAINTYGRYYSSGSEREQFKELLGIIFGPETKYPNFDRRNVISMISAAARHKTYHFLQNFDEAYYAALHGRTLISLHDFIDYRDLRHRDELTLNDVQHAAYKSISSYFCRRYFERIKVLKEIPKWKELDHVSKEVIRLQTRTRFYPMMGIRRDEQLLQDALFDSADRFAQKRKRLKRERDAIPRPSIANYPKLSDYAASIDAILASTFKRNILDSEYKANQTLKDIEKLGWDDIDRSEVKPSSWKSRRGKMKKKTMISYDKEKDQEVRKELGSERSEIGDISDQLITGKRPWHLIGEKFYKKWVLKHDSHLSDISQVTTNLSANLGITTTTAQLQSNESVSTTDEQYEESGTVDMMSLLGGYDDEETYIKTTVQLSDWYGSSGSHGNCFDLIEVMKRHDVILVPEGDYDPSVLKGYIDQYRAEITQESIDSLSRMYKQNRDNPVEEEDDITSQLHEKDKTHDE